MRWFSPVPLVRAVFILGLAGAAVPVVGCGGPPTPPQPLVDAASDATTSPSDAFEASDTPEPGLPDTLITPDTPETTAPQPTPGDYRTWTDISYQTATGWDPALATLDLYAADTPDKKPLLVYVHGGSWHSGDKSNLALAPAFIEFFTQRGYLVAALNVRLFKDERSPGAGYREEATDIARAIAWLLQNGAEYGGDAGPVVLVGFSSGAHLVALVAADSSYLQAEGLSTRDIRGSISLDVPDYHVPTAFALRQGTDYEAKLPMLRALFGATEAEQLAASPANYLQNPDLPPLLLISAGLKDGTPQLLTNQSAADFKNRLLKSGHDARHFHFPDYEHLDLMTRFNTPGDGLAILVGAYLDRLDHPPAPEPLSESVRVAIDAAIVPKVDPSGQDPTLPTAMVVCAISGGAREILGYGNTEAGAGVTPGPDHFFSLGSISKVFTGLILAQEELAGQVSKDDLINDRIGAPLAGLLNPETTLAQLVSHRAGLASMPENLTAFRDLDGDGKNDATPTDPANNYSLDLLLACLQNGACQPTYPVGEAYHYSNLGIGLLGIALQHTAPVETFDRLHQRQITFGLEMDDIGVLSAHFSQKTLGRTVVGYMPKSGELVATGYAGMGILAPSGGLIGTGRSMMRILAALTFPDSTPLGPAIAAATSPLATVEDGAEAGDGGAHQIAYAIEIKTRADGTVTYYKGGLTPGSTALLSWRPSAKAGVLVMTNRGQFVKIRALADHLLDLLAAP